MGDEGANSKAVFLSRCEPVRMHFAWHPACEPAAALAREVAAELGETGDVEQRGAGLPCYFATSTLADDGSAPVPAPLPDPPEAPALSVVVPLLDARFVADPRWRAWLRGVRYATDGQAWRARPQRLVLPVALDPEGYRMPGINDLGYMQIDPPGSGHAPEARAAFRADRLARRLVVAVARRLLDRKALTVFLSHAKADGRDIAAALRERIVGYDQIEFFFDENDLPSGHAFDVALEQATVGVPAMIAVQTGRYAERPWCRRELALFRRPRQSGPGRWHLRPLVVVDGLGDRPTRVLSEVAGAPLMRWAADGADAVLDRLMREVLLGEYNRLRADGVGAAIAADPPTDGSRDAAQAKVSGGTAGDTAIIDWVPDSFTVARVRAESEGLARLVYPGDGLSRLDQSALRVAAPGVELTTFGQALAGAMQAPTRAPLGTVVGLSAGNPPPTDLVARGIGPAHVEAVLLRLSRRILQMNFDLAYGGRLNEGFTDKLRRLVRAEEPVSDPDGARLPSSDRRRRDPIARPERPVLVNLLSANDALSPRDVARDLGLVRYVRCGCPPPPSSIDPAVGRALAVTRMRQTLSAPPKAEDGEPVNRPLARVVIGGKLAGYSGFVPGIADEIALSLAAGIPVFVVGLVGGAAHSVGRLLLGELSPEAALDPHGFRRSRAFVGLREAARAAGASGDLDAAWDRAVALAGRGMDDNGLAVDENRRLVEATDLDTVLGLLTKGLAGLLSR